MGLWDMIVDNVLEPVGGLIIDGVEATGRGIDAVVTTGIDVIGGGIDKTVEIVKEHPLETAVTVGAAVLSGGSSTLIGTAARTLGATALTAATTTTSSTIAAQALTAATIAAKTSVSPMTKTLGGALLAGAISSLNDNYVCEKTKPVMGSVLYCDLALIAEHSGIYVGKGKIAHLDGSGKIEIVTARQFLKRLGGLNPAISIYVSCNEETAVGSSRVAKLAKAMAGGERTYNVILDNCHQFASGCITGDFDNADNFLWMLKHTAEKEMSATCWRVWDL